MIIAEVPRAQSRKEVDHPSYYNAGGIEVWDIFRAFKLSVPKAFAVKYILRAGVKDKHKEIEDLNKAINCLERAKQEIFQRLQAEVQQELAERDEVQG